MLLAMADVRAVLVVLAGRLARLRPAAEAAVAAVSGSGGVAGAAARAEAREGLRVFAPLANRLGVWSLKAELEDLCFQVRTGLRCASSTVSRHPLWRSCCIALPSRCCACSSRYSSGMLKHFSSSDQNRRGVPCVLQSLPLPCCACTELASRSWWAAFWSLILMSP